MPASVKSMVLQDTLSTSPKISYKQEIRLGIKGLSLFLDVALPYQ